jgi:hypothetical protein
VTGGNVGQALLEAEEALAAEAEGASAGAAHLSPQSAAPVASEAERVAPQTEQVAETGAAFPTERTEPPELGAWEQAVVEEQAGVRREAEAGEALAFDAGAAVRQAHQDHARAGDLGDGGGGGGGTAAAAAGPVEERGAGGQTVMSSQPVLEVLNEISGVEVDEAKMPRSAEAAGAHAPAPPRISSESARPTDAHHSGEKGSGSKGSSSFFSFFGRKKTEVQEVEAGPEVQISSEVCALVISDIEALLNDPARKSSSLLKILNEARERVREVAKQAKDAGGEAKMLSCSSVLKAGVQAAETGHKTLAVKGLALVRRLACYHAVQPVYFPAVSKALRSCAESGDDKLQVKVLQVCAAAANSHALAGSIGPALSIVEAILVVMGSPVVSGANARPAAGGTSGAAEATLHQAVKSVMGVVVKRRDAWLQAAAVERDKERASLEAAAGVAAQVLQEVSVLCTSKASERLKYRRAERAQLVALTLLEDILRSYADVISLMAPLTSWLSERLCPILLKHMHQITGGAMRMLPRESPPDYAQRVAVGAHYLNLVAALVSNFPQVEC